MTRFPRVSIFIVTVLFATTLHERAASGADSR